SMWGDACGPGAGEAREALRWRCAVTGAGERTLPVITSTSARVLSRTTSGAIKTWPREPCSDAWLANQLEGSRAAVGDARLAPYLDRERDLDEREDQVEQVLDVGREVADGKAVAVLDRLRETGERDVIERLHARHRRREPLRIAEGLGVEDPLGEHLEVGKLGGQETSGGTRPHRPSPEALGQVHGERTGTPASWASTCAFTAAW